MDLNIDYSQYEGRELKVVINDKEHECVVAGCDPEIGITFADKEFGDPVACLTFETKHRNPKTWEQEFDSMVSEIKAGFSAAEGNYHENLYDICAFMQ